MVKIQGLQYPLTKEYCLIEVYWSRWKIAAWGAGVNWGLVFLVSGLGFMRFGGFLGA